MDSQSVKTTEKGGVKGFDAGKKVKGRKRHLVVDSLGLILLVMVTAANVQDRDAGRCLICRIHRQFKRLKLIVADAAYRGTCAEWIRRVLHLMVDIVERMANQVGFRVQRKRWIVERTFAWLGRYRRLSKDYEFLPHSSETMIYIAMSHLMLQRLAPKQYSGLRWS